MTDATLTALRESIAHWERMRDDRECQEQPVSQHCALCQRFNAGEFVTCGTDDGEPCPVYAKSGKVLCEGTPYYNALLPFAKRRKNWPTWQAAAQREIDFLKSLLPEGEVA